jgi:hypothetical protein
MLLFDLEQFPCRAEVRVDVMPVHDEFRGRGLAGPYTIEEIPH